MANSVEHGTKLEGHHLNCIASFYLFIYWPDFGSTGLVVSHLLERIRMLHNIIGSFISKLATFNKEGEPRAENLVEIRLFDSSHESMMLRFDTFAHTS